MSGNRIRSPDFMSAAIRSPFFDKQGPEVLPTWPLRGRAIGWAARDGRQSPQGNWFYKESPHRMGRSESSFLFGDHFDAAILRTALVRIVVCDGM